MTVELERNGRLVIEKIYVLSGCAEAQLPIDIKLDKIPDDVFETVRDLIGRLARIEREERAAKQRDTTRSAISDWGLMGGDCYEISVGKRSARRTKRKVRGRRSKQLVLRSIFNEFFTDRSPLADELYKTLAQYASKEDFVLKP